MKLRGRKNVRWSGVLLACVISLILSPILASGEETYKFERMWPTLQQPWYFGNAEGIAVDGEDFVYVVDMYSHCIRKFTSDGFLVTQWGSYGEGPGQFNTPVQAAIDKQNGWIYVVENHNHRVQKFTLDGEFLTSWEGSGGENGNFSHPKAIAVDKDGSVYVSDSAKQRIQKFKPDGTHITWGYRGEGDGEFLSPKGIAIDRMGSVYVADSETHCIQKFEEDGNQYEFVSKWCGGENGVELNSPRDIVIDDNNIMYVADEGDNSIQVFDLNKEQDQYVGKWGEDSERISLEERMNQLIDDYLELIQAYRMNFRALTDMLRYLPTSVENGTFKNPKSIAVDSNGHIYVADSGNQRIQKLKSDGEFLSKWTGIGKKEGMFQLPLGIAVYKENGEEYICVADTGNHRIQVFRRKDGRHIRTWGSEGKSLGQFEFPGDVAVDEDGNIYVADTLNARIQKIEPNGHIEVWGEGAIKDGNFTGIEPGKFVLPMGITVHGNYIYVADLGGNYIHKLDKDSGEAEGGWDAQSPAKLAVDEAGNVYSSNEDCNCIQKFTPGGTLVEGWKIRLSEESETAGPAFGYGGLAIAKEGEKEFLYVTTGEYNFCVRKFNLEQNGKATFLKEISGPGHEIGQVMFPTGIAIDEDGKIYVADTGNHRIQVFRESDTEQKKCAIIGPGRKMANDYLWNATEMSANFAYRALMYQGFTKDTIHYLSPAYLDSETKFDLDGDGKSEIDADITKLRETIQGAKDSDEVVIYLMDHGDIDTFYMKEGDHSLSASSLADLLNELQAGSGPNRVILVYDACHSGSFLDNLKLGDGLRNEGKERIVITSTSEDKIGEVINQGAISFSSYFWNNIFNGLKLGEAFKQASEAMGLEKQMPCMDDNEGGNLAQEAHIGNGMFIYENMPKIGEISATEPDDKNTSKLSAINVTDDDGIARVWALIRPPDYDHDPAQPVCDLPSVELFLEEEGEKNYIGEYDGFDKAGDYQIFIYARDSVGKTSPPKLHTITVETTLKRKAIIVLGEHELEDVKNAIRAMGILAYNTLTDQTYSPDDIFMLMPSGTVLEGITPPSHLIFGTSPEILRQAIETLRTNSDTQDLVLYMIGKGGDGVFHMNPTDSLKASDLCNWLNQLQDEIPGKVTFIYDACHSGSFLPHLIPLEGQERIVISSTTESQPAYFFVDGEISFSKYFWNNVLDGASILQAFEYARGLISYASRTYNQAKQSPQLDDSGNGKGNENLWSRFSQIDGKLSQKYKIGAGIMRADGDVAIRVTSASQTLSLDKRSAFIRIEPVIATAEDISKVWAVIPSDSDEHGEQCSITRLDTQKEFEHVESNGYQLEVTYDDFPDDGEYLITIYAEDEEGKLSDPVRTKICRGDSDLDGIGDCWDEGDILQDSDNDGVPDDVDVFDNNAAEQYDTDGDGIGDNQDTDDDNDGITDIFEEFYGTNPIKSEADGECDSSGNAAGSTPQVSWQTLNATDPSGTKDTYTISGHIGIPESGRGTKDGIPGVVLEGAPGDVKTGDGGFYSFEVPLGWKGTITPSKTDHIFIPSKWEYKDVKKDAYNQDYVAVSLEEMDASIIEDDIETARANDYLIESAQSGDWNDETTWKSKQIPTKDDIVLIHPGHTITFKLADEIIEVTDEANQLCGSGNTELNEGNEIKGLYISQDGVLKSEPMTDIKLRASDFIYNNGEIRGADAYDDPEFTFASSSGSTTTEIPEDSSERLHDDSQPPDNFDLPGANVILTADNLFYNDADGTIQGGRGGDHYGEFAVGGDGGSVEIYGDMIVNEGVIGPDCDSDSDGGHGGHAKTPSGLLTHCYDAYGGNGGNVVLLAKATVLNKSGGQISAGKGGKAYFGHCSGYGGRAGDITFSAPVAIQNGIMKSCGKGGYVSCDPSPSGTSAVSIGDGAEITGDDISIFGGNNWTLSLGGINADALAGAKTVTFAVGACGTLDLRGLREGDIKADKVNIYADNILKDDCVSISDIFDGELEIHPSAILHDFTMRPAVTHVSGTAGEFVYIPVFLINNGPEEDFFDLEVKDPSKNTNLTESGDVYIDGLENHDKIPVSSLSREKVCLRVPLPDTQGESMPLIIEVKLRKDEGEDPLFARSTEEERSDADYEKVLYAKVTVTSVEPTVGDGDEDNDGVPDAMEENVYETDPTNPDTDGDGMTDGWEIYYGLNPGKIDGLPENSDDSSDDPDGDDYTNLEEFQGASNPNDPDSTPEYLRYEFPKDSDGDELPDVVEEKYGTDSENPDTDGDGIPDGWEVYHGLNPEEQDDAEDRDDDGRTNLEEYETWKGFKDCIESQEDEFTEDTDADGIKDCWEDHYLPDPSVDDASEDPDGDGFTNLEEFEGKSNPNDEKSMPESDDSDNDGLPDVSEGEYKTDPDKPDTDEDGIPDIWEIFHGLNPLEDTPGDIETYEAWKNFGNECTESPEDEFTEDNDEDGMRDCWEDHYLLDSSSADDAFDDPDEDGFTNLDEFIAQTDPLDKDSNIKSKDSDKDDLPDIFENEKLFGTDPENPDTDNDGMNDGWETYYRLEPLSTDETQDDPDGDGFTNLEEYSVWKEYRGCSDPLLHPDEVSPDEACMTVPNLSFKRGVFVAGGDGVVRIDWLYDGGAYQGEFGIFELSGMEAMTKGEFISEAIRRVADENDPLGYVVFSDKTEGAQFRGRLTKEISEWNSGLYKGTKRLRMSAEGARFATVLIPNATFDALLDTSWYSNETICENDDEKCPLFSIVSPNSDRGMHLGQMADINGMGKAFAIEDIDMKSPSHWNDRDYNDLIVQITGATLPHENAIPSLDALVKKQDNAKRKRSGKGNWFDWRTDTELGRLIMEHIEMGEQAQTPSMSVEIDGCADLLVYAYGYSPDGEVISGAISKDGGHIPGAIFEIDEDTGHQMISLPRGDDYRIVLHGRENASCEMTVKEYQENGDEVLSETANAEVENHKMLKSDDFGVAFSSASFQLYYDFDRDGDIDDNDLFEKLGSMWDTCIGDQDFDAFYDLDNDGCITVLDIMKVSSSISN
ncbi:MAG: hypothetical protein B6245_06495 [Desulfobacteraceae bacterium 4572_88]|nr:MAG: hypothetical protein B6245_06495 [Desulfobacteraceae bacterium 4572_88]